MKKLILLSAIAMSGLVYQAADAQIGIRLGLRIGPARVIVQAPAVAAPVCQETPVGYDANDDYFYLPDLNAYYSVPEQCYYYYDGDNWISAAYLPGFDRNFDWRNARRFEIRAPRPYLHNDFYMQKYRSANYNWANNDNRGDHDRYADNNRQRYVQPAENDNRDGQKFNRDKNQDGKNDNRQQFAQNSKNYDGHHNDGKRF